MKYRSRTDVAQAILESCLSPRPWTQVMYDSYTSHTQMEEYISVLTARGYMTMDRKSKSKILCITRTGIKLLAQMKDVGKALAVVESRVQRRK